MVGSPALVILLSIHWNPLVIKFKSESAAHSMVHQNPFVIKFGLQASLLASRNPVVNPAVMDFLLRLSSI